MRFMLPQSREADHMRNRTEDRWGCRTDLGNSELGAWGRGLGKVNVELL